MKDGAPDGLGWPVIGPRAWGSRPSAGGWREPAGVGRLGTRPNTLSPAGTPALVRWLIEVRMHNSMSRLCPKRAPA
jgi:hypothetical protein